MGNGEIRLGGFCTFWGVREWTNRQKLLDNLTALNLEAFCPEQRTPPACLKDALNSIYKKNTELVRPLASKDGFTVVEETKGEFDKGGNTYKTVITARIEKDTLKTSIQPYDYDVATTVLDQFNRHLGLLRQANVAEALVKYAASLGATTLRPGGGFYWIPDARLAEWQVFAAAVEQAGEGSPNSVYLLRTAMDADAVRAVRDAVTREITEEAESLKKEVLEGELGERGLENRRQKAMGLRAKTQMYEEILGTALDSLRQSVGELEDAAANAALLASMQPQKETS